MRKDCDLFGFKFFRISSIRKHHHHKYHYLKHSCKVSQIKIFVRFGVSPSFLPTWKEPLEFI